jgi:hypothetical protein
LFVCAAIIIAAGLVHSEEQKPPAVQTEKNGERDITEQIFKNPGSLTVADPNKAAKCPVCGEPLWKHAEPDFECLPRDKKIVRIKEAQANCPVCGFVFKGPLPSEMSKYIEVDSDFCRHAIGKTSVVGRVWMCPKCGYAAWFDRFNQPVDAATVSYVKNNISQQMMKQLKELLDIPGLQLDDLSFLEQIDIPDSVKYGNAMQLAALIGLNEVELARLALEASHAARRAVNERLPAVFLSSSLQLLDELTADNAGEPMKVADRVSRFEEALVIGKIGDKNVDAAGKFCLNMTLAGLYDRLGNLAQTRACLDAAEQLVPSIRTQNEGQQKSLARTVANRKMHLEEEAQRRMVALELYRRLISSNQVQGADLLGAGYIVGELLRRDGRNGAAKAWFMELVPLAARVDRYMKDKVLALLDTPAMTAVAVDENESALAKKALAAMDVAASAETAAEATAPATVQETPATAVNKGAPPNCRALMENFYAAVTLWRKTHNNEWPADRDELVKAGLLTEEAVNGWVCPDSKAAIMYRRPPNDQKTFILFHKDPTNCPCKLLLFSDGTIQELGSPQQ